MFLSTDNSDYIGCYENNEDGVYLKNYQNQKMTQCLCIGYCKSLNYTLAGIYYRYDEH